jgi:plasmid stability protein
MRTTLDIPDETYRRLKIRAATERQTIREIALRGIERELNAAVAPQPPRRFQVPVIPSSQPGTLNLTNEQIDDILASS